MIAWIVAFVDEMFRRWVLALSHLVDALEAMFIPVDEFPNARR